MVSWNGTIETIRAIAVRTGMKSSAVSEAVFEINYWKVATPTFSPTEGTFTSDQTVRISCTTPGADIHYTLDGSEPTVASPIYTDASPISVSGNGAVVTIRALAVKEQMDASAIASATYHIDFARVSTPQFDPPAGMYAGPQNVIISSQTAGASIHYTTDGSVPTSTTGILYTVPVSVAASSELKAIAYASGMTDSTVASAAYAIGVSYPLAVDAAGRHLVDQGGQPFLLVGDAAWSLVAQLSDADASEYLADRRQRGFNTVIVNLLEHQFAANAPADIYDINPFTGSAFSTPNEEYFVHVDHIITTARENGILVLLDPVYVGHNCGSEGWCSEIQQASLADMTAWGQYIGDRYGDDDNIMWLIGGDTDPAPVKDKLRAVVDGIRQYDSRHLMTAHNAPETMAVTPWTGDSWLTVNSTYTYVEAYLMAETAYSLAPHLPFFLLEAAYENEHSVTAQQLRAQSYWTVLSGGIGHVFGNCPIWHFGGDTSGAFCPSVDWQSQLGGQGSKNMQFFASLFRTRHWYALEPDLLHTSVTGGYGVPGDPEYVTAAVASDGSSLIAYLPTSRTVTVSGAALSGASMKAWWFDPSTGTASEIGSYPTDAPQSFTPPASGDWVLVVDSESFGFTAPGG